MTARAPSTNLRSLRSLNLTIPHPFPRRKHGRICVKVINHFGDEVQKVFQV